MTAHATQSDREKSLAAGMDDYITKPLRKDELLAIVKKWTHPAWARAEDSRTKPEVMNAGLDGRPLDFEAAVKEFDDDREFLVEVLQGFLRNVRNQVATIQQAIADENTETVWREAHSIKGGAMNLTADALAAEAANLETIGRQGQLEECPAALEKLTRAFGRLEKYTRAHLAGVSESGK
jgi:HPt (histidine-containing phosphotransfer) domain-containing protein